MKKTRGLFTLKLTATFIGVATLIWASVYYVKNRVEKNVTRIISFSDSGLGDAVKYRHFKYQFPNQVVFSDLYINGQAGAEGIVITARRMEFEFSIFSVWMGIPGINSIYIDSLVLRDSQHGFDSSRMEKLKEEASSIERIDKLIGDADLFANSVEFFGPAADSTLWNLKNLSLIHGHYDLKTIEASLSLKNQDWSAEFNPLKINLVGASLFKPGDLTLKTIWIDSLEVTTLNNQPDTDSLSPVQEPLLPAFFENHFENELNVKVDEYIIHHGDDYRLEGRDMSFAIVQDTSRLLARINLAAQLMWEGSNFSSNNTALIISFKPETSKLTLHSILSDSLRIGHSFKSTASLNRMDVEKVLNHELPRVFNDSMDSFSENFKVFSKHLLLNPRVNNRGLNIQVNNFELVAGKIGSNRSSVAVKFTRLLVDSNSFYDYLKLQEALSLYSMAGEFIFYRGYQVAFAAINIDSVTFKKPSLINFHEYSSKSAPFNPAELFMKFPGEIPRFLKNSSVKIRNFAWGNSGIQGGTVRNLKLDFRESESRVYQVKFGQTNLKDSLLFKKNALDIAVYSSHTFAAQPINQKLSRQNLNNGYIKVNYLPDSISGQLEVDGLLNGAILGVKMHIPLKKRGRKLTHKKLKFTGQIKLSRIDLQNNLLEFLKPKLRNTITLRGMASLNLGISGNLYQFGQFKGFIARGSSYISRGVISGLDLQRSSFIKKRAPVFAAPFKFESVAIHGLSVKPRTIHWKSMEAKGNTMNFNSWGTADFKGNLYANLNVSIPKKIVKKLPKTTKNSLKKGKDGRRTGSITIYGNLENQEITGKGKILKNSIVNNLKAILGL